MPKNILTIQRLEKLFTESNEPMNPHEIRDAFKQRWPKSLPSMARLSNLLSRHKQFEEVGFSKIEGPIGADRVKVWQLNERMV